MFQCKIKLVERIANVVFISFLTLSVLIKLVK